MNLTFLPHFISLTEVDYFAAALYLQNFKINEAFLFGFGDLCFIFFMLEERYEGLWL